MTKAIWVGNGLFCSEFYITVHYQKHRGQELKQSRNLGQELMQR